MAPPSTQDWRPSMVGETGLMVWVVPRKHRTSATCVWALDARLDMTHNNTGTVVRCGTAAAIANSSCGWSDTSATCNALMCGRSVQLGQHCVGGQVNRPVEFQYRCSCSAHGSSGPSCNNGAAGGRIYHSGGNTEADSGRLHGEGGWAPKFDHAPRAFPKRTAAQRLRRASSALNSV